jgi:hypothetical protein
LFAFSASGVRNSQGFFFEEGKDWTVESLRNALGDFSKALSTGIPKYAARLGQTLSKSVCTVTVRSSLEVY